MIFRCKGKSFLLRKNKGEGEWEVEFYTVQKIKFSIKIWVGNCRFGHIYRRNP